MLKRLIFGTLMLGALSLPISGLTQTETSNSALNGEIIVKGQLKRKDGPGVTSITVTQAANLRELADQNGYDGKSDAEILFTVPADATIMGRPGGGSGIDTGVWPANAHIALIINGRVYGGGGKGGDGGLGARSGGAGGDALYVRVPLIVFVAEKGALEAGGGGGGGAGDQGFCGGGGGGFPNGGFGVSTSGGDPGRPGTPDGAGRGGGNMSMPGSFSEAIGNNRPSMLERPSPGGNGGNAGRDGDSGGGNKGAGGGGAGYAIRANGMAVQLILSGRLRGEIG